jgi:uncharacterized Tic20 family protein
MLDRTEHNRLKWEMLAYFDNLLAYLGNLGPFLGPWSVLGLQLLRTVFSVGLGPRSLSFQNYWTGHISATSSKSLLEL